MSYGFDMGFAQANSLQEAMTIALEYTRSQMTEKNIRKSSLILKFRIGVYALLTLVSILTLCAAS